MNYNQQKLLIKIMNRANDQTVSDDLELLMELVNDPNIRREDAERRIDKLVTIAQSSGTVAVDVLQNLSSIFRPFYLDATNPKDFKRCHNFIDSTLTSFDHIAQIAPAALKPAAQILAAMPEKTRSCTIVCDLEKIVERDGALAAQRLNDLSVRINRLKPSDRPLTLIKDYAAFIEADSNSAQNTPRPKMNTNKRQIIAETIDSIGTSHAKDLSEFLLTLIDARYIDKNRQKTILNALTDIVYSLEKESAAQTLYDLSSMFRSKIETYPDYGDYSEFISSTAWSFSHIAKTAPDAVTPVLHILYMIPESSVSRELIDRLADIVGQDYDKAPKRLINLLSEIKAARSEDRVKLVRTVWKRLDSAAEAEEDLSPITELTSDPYAADSFWSAPETDAAPATYNLLWRILNKYHAGDVKIEPHKPE